MNKAAAKDYMISKVEEIERKRLAAHFSIEATKEKKEAVEAILKELKGVTIDDEDQQN